MFLPVMRGSLSLPAYRDPEILERLQPGHVLNMCTRLQVNFSPFLVKLKKLTIINYLLSLTTTCVRQKLLKIRL